MAVIAGFGVSDSRAGSIRFDLDGDEGEEQDLESAHCSVPHWSADAVRVGEGRTGQESGTPCPS